MFRQLGFVKCHQFIGEMGASFRMAIFPFTTAVNVGAFVILSRAHSRAQIDGVVLRHP